MVIVIPVLMSTAARMEISSSKLLMPLSFASMFGGVCTLLGTSTNILVSSIAADNGLEPFSMFEFTPFGLVIVTTGFIDLYLGLKLVPPPRETTDLEQDFNTADYISDIRVTEEFEHLGKPLQDIEDIWRLDIDVIFLCRDRTSVSDKEGTALQNGDVLRIRGTAEEIDKLIQRRSYFFCPIAWVFQMPANTTGMPLKPG